MAADAVKMQIEVRRRLHEQLEVHELIIDWYY